MESKRVATVSYKAERIVSDSCKYIYIYIHRCIREKCADSV